MNYNKIVSVTGMSGLFELISSKADGGIVKSLEDKSTKFVSNRVHSFTGLEGIEVYTTKDNVNLADVFIAMQNSEEKAPEANADNKAIKAYFEKVYPDMDFERVYSSDMKKMVKWLDILKKNKIEIKAPAEENEDETAGEAVAEKKQVIAKPSSSNKTATVKNAPTKKINMPRKMA
ncbi:MAG: DUF5606 domain-containing protein [Ferruginibacter sp.]